MFLKFVKLHYNVIFGTNITVLKVNERILLSTFSLLIPPFKLLLIPGIITVGNDISQLMVSMLISYYAGRGHRPRWIALGLYTVVLYCFLTGFLHILYGPGNDALSLTEEYGAVNTTLNAICKLNETPLENVYP